MHDWDLRSCWLDLFASYITFLTFTATGNDCMYASKDIHVPATCRGQKRERGAVTTQFRP